MTFPGRRTAASLLRRFRPQEPPAKNLRLPLADDAWIVQRPGPKPRRLVAEQLDRGVWVVQRRSRRRSVVQIGSDRLGTHLLVDQDRVRRSVTNQQTQMAHHLGNEHIVAVLDRLGINCLLDVGANGGQFGARVREGGYQGRIVSFEPLPHIAERLREVAADDPEWHVVEAALGDEASELEMTVVGDQGRTSSLLPASDYGLERSPRLAGVGRQRVPVRRLDEMLDEVTAGIESPRVFLKMDTQGYDVRVFRGAGERISEILGLQSEIACLTLYDGMTRYLDAIALYEDAGFEMTGMYPVTTERTTMRVVEFDVVMVRASAMSGPRR